MLMEIIAYIGLSDKFRRRRVVVSGLSGVLELWEALTQWRIELCLISGTKASERTRRHHKRRLMKRAVSISKARCAVRVVGAWSKTHLHCWFP